MTKLLLRWVLLAVSVLCASLLTNALHLGFKADMSASGFLKIMIGVVVLGFLNATLGKVLKILTLPLSCITLGLFSLVINAIVLMAAASLNLGFSIDGSGMQAFLAAFVSSILISFINGVLGVFLPDDKDE